MEKPEYYYIMAFETTTDAMHAEKCARDTIHAAIMPVPREISSGCGLALRFMEKNTKTIIDFCRENPLNGKLYKMKTIKVNGYHPIEPINIS